MQEYDTIELMLSKLREPDFLRIFHGFRWAEGIRCIKCNKPQHKIYRGKPAGSPANRGKGGLRYHCEPCRIWFNDFTGTPLENSRLDLSQWFKAIHYFLNLGLTCSDAARKLRINRNTAQQLQRKISRNREWCRLLLQRTSGHPATANAIIPLMPLAEVERYLGVSKRTVYRLIATSALSAIKVGGRWRFRAEDIQKYITSKISRYGTTATGEYFYFSENVLDKYRKDKAKYYVHEEAYQGRVGSKQDYQDVHTLKSLRHQISGVRPFAQLHYRKVIAPDGQHALAVSHKDYAKLPAEEYVHWSNYLIHSHRLHRLT